MPKALTFMFARMTPRSIALSTLSGPIPDVRLPFISLYLEPPLSLKFNITNTEIFILHQTAPPPNFWLVDGTLILFYLWSLRILFDISLLVTYYTQSTCKCVGSHPTTASLPPSLLFHFHGQHPNSVPTTQVSQ